MPSLDVIVEQDDFSAGMVRDVAPHLIPQDGVYDIVNGFNGDDDGSIFWRGGNDNYSDADFGTGLRHLWTGHLTPGERILFANASDFGVLNGTTPVNLGGPGLTGPAVCAEIGGLLFIGGGFIYGGSLKAASYTTSGGNTNMTNGSAVVTDATGGFTANVDPGMLLQRGNERVYVVETVDSDTQVTLTEAYEGVTTTTADPTFHNIYTITTADPYVASDTYTVSTARLLWHTTRRVYFSPLRTTAPQENPHTFNATDYHTVPDGNRIIGIASIGQIVLVFTTGGVWRLSGIAYNIVDSATGDPQHSFELLSRDYVLASPAGIATWEQYLIVPCTDGVYMIDGSSAPVRISKRIDPLWQSYMKLGYRTGGAAVYKSRYFLPILGSSDVKDVLVCKMPGQRDRRYKTYFPWSRLRNSGANMAAYAVKNAADPRQPKLLAAEYADTARVSDCTGYFSPGVANKQDADGTTPDFEIVFRDFETGGLTLNTLRWVRLGYELVADVGDEPRLVLDYASGIRLEGAPKWGDPAGEWGVGFGPSGTSPWTALHDGEFSPVMRADVRDYAPPATIDPHRFRLNKRLRYARLKLRAENGPAEWCAIRRLELQIRPSQAVRR